MRTRRVIGGAGTGKTRLILDEMTKAREELGLSPEECGFATLTRNGRRVMASRAAEGWGCSEESLTKHGYFRTAHSTAMRQLGIKPDQILDSEDASIEWVSAKLGADLKTERTETGEIILAARTQESVAAALALSAWNLSRSTLTSLYDILERVREAGGITPPAEAAVQFISRYESAKRLEGRVDFNDLLGRFAGIGFHVEGHIETTPEGVPPESVRAMYIDEAQDASALVDRVCRRLAQGPNVERCLITGDMFQAIFGFGGSDYRHFMDWDAEQSIMPQSYRCPQVIMDLGERCLSEMHEGYWPRNIAPASHDGEVEQAGAAEDAIDAIDLNESTLIIARCNYTLPAYEKHLHSRDIPFCRLNEDPSESLAGFNALWQLQHIKEINHDQWQSAIQLFPVKCPEAGQLLVHGEKEAWKEGRHVFHWDLIWHKNLEQIGCTPTLANAIRSGEWLDFVVAKYWSLGNRWLASARRHGPELATNPKVRTATIHAAKGAEGDAVILATETSKKIERSKLLVPERHDEECRVAYVAVTRARKRLIVVRDAGPHRMNLPV
jgi:DNA helicase II / ATP-dependent DNA helicase PcrA